MSASKPAGSAKWLRSSASLLPTFGVSTVSSRAVNPRRFRPLDERPRDATILEHIELKPARRRDHRVDILHPGIGQRAYAVYDARRRGGAGRNPFGKRRGQAVEGAWSDDDRHRHVASEHRRLRVDVAHTSQHPRPEEDLIVRATIGLERDLVHGAGGVIVIPLGSHPGLGQTLILKQIEGQVRRLVCCHRSVTFRPYRVTLEKPLKWRFVIRLALFATNLPR